jgi:hypothetical protein
MVSAVVRNDRGRWSAAVGGAPRQVAVIAAVRNWYEPNGSRWPLGLDLGRHNDEAHHHNGEGDDVTDVTALLPFRIDVPQNAVDDLKERLARTPARILLMR